MLEHQREGVAKAGREGRHLGREHEICPPDVWRRVVAKALGVSRSNVYRHLPGADGLALVCSYGTAEARERSNLALLTPAVLPDHATPYRRDQDSLPGLPVLQTRSD